MSVIAIDHYERLSAIDFLPELASAGIHEKTRIIQQFVENHFYAESGLFYSLLLIDGEQSARPMTQDEVQSQVWHTCGDEHLDTCVNRTEGMLYENSLTSAGIYLKSQVNRYRATGDPEAMREAERVFASIEMVYRWNAEAGKPGHLSKPYGETATRTSTPDQYLFALTGLYEFYRLESCPAKDTIVRILVDCADYCMTHEYQVCELTPWRMISERGAYNAIYMLIPLLAYRVSGDTRYRDEMERVARMGYWREETYFDEWRRSGKERMLMFERVCLPHFALVSAEIFAKEVPELFGASEDEQRRALSQCVSRWWEFGSLGVDDEFYQNYWIDIDVKNETWRSTGLTPLIPKEQMPESQKEFFFMRYHSDVKFSPSLYRQLHNSFIMSLFPANEERRETGLSWVREILERTNGQRLRWMIDLDGRQLLPEVKYHGCILDSESPFHYLNVYWLAKARGIL